MTLADVLLALKLLSNAVGLVKNLLGGKELTPEERALLLREKAAAEAEFDATD
jgi:hypothetical protein